MTNVRSSVQSITASCSRRSFLKTTALGASTPALLSTARGVGSMQPDPRPTPLTFKSATQLASMIRNGEISPVEVLQKHLDRIEQVEPRIQAIEYLAEGKATAFARRAEKAIANRAVEWEKQPLFGVPISLKDNIEVRGMPTKCGAPSLKDYCPKQDATVVRRLKAAGAIVLAKTRMPFLASQYESANLFGQANNPYDESERQAAAVEVGQPWSLRVELRLTLARTAMGVSASHRIGVESPAWRRPLAVCPSLACTRRQRTRSRTRLCERDRWPAA